MKEIINKIIPGLLTAMIIGIVGAFGQIRDNAAAIETISKEMETLEKKHVRRLENLELSREAMPEYYVTRREFNAIIQALDEKMDKVDRNVEKLIDMQMKKNKE